jgi:hypothetical protein
VAEAGRAVAALTGESDPLEPVALAAESSRLPSAVPPVWDGQTLKETSPTSVTKTIAAPASSAPGAPTPTMKLSRVFEFLVAA